MTAPRLGLLAWFGLVGIATYVLLIGGTYPGYYNQPARIVTHVFAVAIVGGWLALALLRPRWRADTPLRWPALAIVAALVLSGIFSQRPRLSLEPVLTGAAIE